MAFAQYRVFIDWDNDGGTLLSDFEVTLDGWTEDGGILPTIQRSTTQVFSGNYSLLVTWPNFNPFQFDTAGRGFSQGRFGPEEASGSSLERCSTVKELDNFIVGRDYVITAHVFVPTGSPSVEFSADALDTATSSTNDAWQELTLAFTATSTSHTLKLQPTVDPASGGTVYLDYVVRVGSDEEITERVLASRSPLSFKYGRDQIRSLSAVSPGQMDFEVDNQSKDYSPDNPLSPIAGFLAPGREALVTAEYNAQSYPLFRGFLDDYEIFPGPLQRSVQFTALDLLARMESFQLSTEAYPVLRTGDAINLVLDMMGWPEDRRAIDPGATTVRWWNEEGTSALEAVNRLVKSEGIPSLAFINPFGIFVFRDRHHRLISDRSLNVQANWDGEGGPEPQISEPFTYDIGWKDLFNVFHASTDEKKPDNTQVVWDNTTTVVLSSGETQSFIMQFTDPVTEAITPVEGVDYLVSLGTVQVELSRTSGNTIEAFITAVGGAAEITFFQLRAKPIVTIRTYQIIVKDPASIDQHGEKVYNEDAPWAGKNDLYALADIVLGHRAERLPTIEITINNGTNERLTEILTRELSDRVHVVEPETFTDHDYYVESAKHTIAQAGQSHVVAFGTERVREQVANVFTFDDPARGFNDGVFGIAGLSDPSNIFILGQSNLGEGFLGY